METGPLKRSDITITRSDRQRGPARTGQLGMHNRPFKGDSAGKDDLFAVVVAQTVTTILPNCLFEAKTASLRRRLPCHMKVADGMCALQERRFMTKGSDLFVAALENEGVDR